MGVIFSRWRKHPSTVEVLEKIDKDIASLERENRGNLERQKRMIGSLVLYSVFFYIIAAVAFYLYYRPHAWRDQLIYITPLLIFPLLVWTVKVLLHWYFVKRITKNATFLLTELALGELKETKDTILENVKETETYKKAKEILEKFAPEKTQTLETPTTARMSPPRQGQELRQRVLAPQQGVTPPPRMQTPRMQTPATGGALMSPPRHMAPPDGTSTPRPTPGQQPIFQRLPPGPPLPCPVLPRERSTVEMLVEYLVGDGPQNRYALVCQQCHSHNGMALKEEFEYLAFRCCYCFNLNPARKQRPRAPQLNLGTPHRRPETGPHKDAARASNRDVDIDVKTTEQSPDIDDAATSTTDMATEPGIVHRKTSRATDDKQARRDTQTEVAADDVTQPASTKKTD